jgi:hypothetical protein
VSTEPEVDLADAQGETCRVLGYGARLTGKRLARILGAEGSVAIAMAVVILSLGIHESSSCAPHWYGTTPNWGGFGSIAWALLIAFVALAVVGAALLTAARTAWLPPLDPKNRRVALAAGLISGQPIVFLGMSVAVILLLPFVSGDHTLGSAATWWRWFDQGFMLVALVSGACVGWRACIAAASAPHRTQIICTIIVTALLLFLSLHAAGVTRLSGGELAPYVSPGSFLSHGCQ